PMNGEAKLRGEGGGPALSLGWLHCGRIVAIIWSQTPNARSPPLERFVKARHARFSDGIMSQHGRDTRLSTALEYDLCPGLCLSREPSECGCRARMPHKHRLMEFIDPSTIQN